MSRPRAQVRKKSPRVRKPKAARPAAQRGPGGKTSKAETARLRRELTESKRRLRTALTQLSITNEELQSSNEELRSSNEELQSSNEDLESSREELSSMNEELTIVNGRLAERLSELTHSSSDLSNLLESSDIATLLLDAELRVSRFTAAATSLFALKDGDLGRPIGELRMLASYPAFLADARAVAAGAAPVETHIQDANQRSLIARLAPYRTPQGRAAGVVATFLDVTSLEAARMAIRDNAEELRMLFDHVSVGIAVTDMQGRILDANRALCAMLDLDRDDLIRRHLPWQRAARDGRVGLSVHDDLLAGKRPQYDAEERYIREDGTTLWAHVSVSLTRPAGAANARAVHVIQDVSEAKKSEKLLRAQEGFVRLGEMAAAIAHEVRSPLVAILGAVDLLAMRLPEDASERRVVGEIRQRVASLDSLVNELLLFARPPELRFTRVPLRQVLEDARNLLKDGGEFGDVALTVVGDDVEVLGDPELLKSVFVNLGTNAAHAMNGCGNLEVTLKPNGGSVDVAFRDTGPGVPESLGEKIFEPFVTTRSHGVGLGLPLAKRIVEAHGGHIALLRSTGMGTTMAVTLPTAPM